LATDLRKLLDFATEAAWTAGQTALARFQTGVPVETKEDGSPVTVADRETEQMLRSLIEERFPDHAIVGEELGEAPRDSDHCWFIDPIDGTRAYVHGVPLFGVLLGLEIAGKMALGVAHLPALGEMLAAARGLGCRWNGRPARVSTVSKLDEALVVYTDAAYLDVGAPAAWKRLQAATALQRGWGDCYGHCLVATGRAEVMLDPIVHPWDCAALLPILEEAGGSFTDWQGRAQIEGGDAFSTNGLLFEEVRALLGERSA